MKNNKYLISKIRNLKIYNKIKNLFFHLIVYIQFALC